MNTLPDPAPEFSFLVDPRRLPTGPVTLSASEDERAALAVRFDIVGIGRLEATVLLTEERGAVRAKGQLEAEIVQTCAITGDDLPATIREQVDLRFVPAANHGHAPGAEVELTADQLDEIEYEGAQFDLGEAIAESLALAIDPYAAGPDAEKVRQAYGLADEGPKGPLAEALARLVRKGD